MKVQQTQSAYTYDITRRSGEEMCIRKDNGSSVMKQIWNAANIITETKDGLMPFVQELSELILTKFLLFREENHGPLHLSW